MGPARRGVLFLLSLLLLMGLVGTAFAVSTKLALGNPSVVEQQLAASGFYTHFADNAISQARSQSDNSIGSERIPFNDPAIVKAAHEALPASLLQKQGNDAISANYAWLEGKQPKPNFRVDLTSARQDFAAKVGQAVTDRLSALQPCNTAQLQEIAASGNTNPLTLACLPNSVDPQTEGNTISQSISQNSAFLSSAVITPDSIGSDQSQPYYQKLAKAPQAYQLGQKLPYALAALVALLVLLIYLVARPKRKATRRIGVTLTIAGALLLLNKLLADAFFNYIQKHAINGNGSDSMQQSLIDFTHRLESQLVRIDLYFGVAFLVLGVIILLMLRKGNKQAASRPVRPEAQAPKPTPGTTPQPLDNYRAARPNRPAPGAPTSPDQPPRKPPRLIQ